MPKKPYVLIVYNEPLVTDAEAGRKYITESGELKLSEPLGVPTPAPVLDLSEIGVLEEKEDIARALQTLGYKTKIYNVDGNLEKFVHFLGEDEPDVVFNLCESIKNQAIHEMHIAGIYELMGIRYTGSNPLTLGTALNKSRVKEILLHHGLPTPHFQLVKSPVKITLDENLGFPLIVKPSREDASIGIEPASIVTTLAELRKRVRYIFEQYSQPALIEEYIDGRELNVALIGNRRPIVLPISEIDMTTLPKELPRIITYNAKWLKGTEEYECTKGICPAKLPAEVEARVRQLALQAYHLIGCRDYARVDFRLSQDLTPYILEVNPNPDISDDAGFSRSARAYGYTFEEFIGKIVECALERM